VLPCLPGKRVQVLTVCARLTSEDRCLCDRALKAWNDAGNPRVLPAFEKMSAVREALSRAKIPALLELVESYEEAEEPLVVFSDHLAPVEEVGNRDGWAAITGDTPPAQRAGIVQAFQAGDLKGLALTIAAGGLGLAGPMSLRVNRSRALASHSSPYFVAVTTMVNHSASQVTKADVIPLPWMALPRCSLITAWGMTALPSSIALWTRARSMSWLSANRRISPSKSATTLTSFAIAFAFPLTTSARALAAFPAFAAPFQRDPSLRRLLDGSIAVTS
jgi:hypothetical protein